MKCSVFNPLHKHQRPFFMVEGCCFLSNHTKDFTFGPPMCLIGSLCVAIKITHICTSLLCSMCSSISLNSVLVLVPYTPLVGYYQQQCIFFKNTTILLFFKKFKKSMCPKKHLQTNKKMTAVHKLTGDPISSSTSCLSQMPRCHHSLCLYRLQQTLEHCGIKLQLSKAVQHTLLCQKNGSHESHTSNCTRESLG